MLSQGALHRYCAEAGTMGLPTPHDVWGRCPVFLRDIQGCAALSSHPAITIMRVFAIVMLAVSASGHDGVDFVQALIFRSTK